MINSRLLSLFFILLTVSCVSRKPSSIESSDDVYFGVKKISDNKSLLLIGNACDKKINAACIDWSELGFKNLEHNNNIANAKFILTLNDDILEDAYVFEYGNHVKRKIYQSQENDASPLSHYIKLPKEFPARLPRHFLNVSEVKRQRLPLSLVNYTLTGLGFTPLSPYSETISNIIQLVENKKIYHASYLARIIEMAVIDNKYKNLAQYLGEEQLLSLGSALRIRYRGESSKPITTIGTSQEERNLYYKEALQYKTEKQSINMSKLIQRANEENLTVKVYSRDCAILYYDPTKTLHPSKFNSLLLNTKRKENLETYNEKSQQKLVPLGIFMMSDSLQPTQAINFEDTKTPLRDERITKLLEFGVSVGISFISNGTLSTIAKGGNFVMKLILKKRGKIYKKVLIESEGNLRALIDSGLIEIDPQEIATNMFLAFLEDAGFESDVLEYYEQKLKSSDKVEIAKIIDEILTIFQSSQTSKRKLSGLNQKYNVINRLYSTHSLQNLLGDEKEVYRLLKELDERKEQREKRIVKRQKKIHRKEKRKQRREQRKELKRNPTSANNSAIVFMVDGLRPDRFKEAIKKGLMPTLKEYFIDNGLEFDSFTTKSLTLPSWSSILTGYDIDEHGVKSNGPMSRMLGSPGQNYIDPRKDLLSKKNRQSSRSLQHLKESGLKWLPDYFEKAEVVTNYLPINQEAFPAVGQMIKIIAKDYDKILFKNFSGSIALDRAGAMQTANKIRKNAGQTKLILNWYTCVDVFSHHNNLALEQCYRELDQTVKIVLDAAKEDPILKDAHLFMISDHGHTGGHESEHSHYKLFKEGSYFNNTSLNLTTLFSGDYAQYPHFDFYPFVMESPHIDNDLRFLYEYQLHPFNYKYRSKKKKFKNRSPDIMIDYSGDAMAQIYLRKRNSGWLDQLNFFELTHLNGRNMLEDLLKIKLENYVIYDKKTLNEIKNQTAGHPIMAYALALRSCSDDDINTIVKEKIVHDRYPVLIKGLESDYGLILTQQIEGQIHYKYVLLKEFSQDKEGKCLGIIAENTNKDVLHHFNKVKNRWISKIDFINEMRDEEYPTSLVTLVANLTLAKNLKNNLKREAEIPDFLVLPNIGFNFNSAAITEADHGSLRKQEVNNSFFISKIGGPKFSPEIQKKAKRKVVLNSYLTPFVLDVTQRHNEFSNKTWPSLEEYIGD